MISKITLKYQITIPKDIRDKMKFYPVKDMDEVVKIAFNKSISPKNGTRKKLK